MTVINLYAFLVTEDWRGQIAFTHQNGSTNE